MRISKNLKRLQRKKDAMIRVRTNVFEVFWAEVSNMDFKDRATLAWRVLTFKAKKQPLDRQKVADANYALKNI